MSKIITVDSCNKCPYFDGYGNCSLSIKYISENERQTIPTWCELPDAKEEKDV